MGPLMTPTTELFYAFINLDDTPLPCDLPEVDVFSRAFKQATIAQPDFNRKPEIFTEQDSPQDSPQDLVFDDFPSSRDPNESGDTSPSSDGSSSAKLFSNTSKYTTSSSDQQSARNSSNKLLPSIIYDANNAATLKNNSQIPQPNISTYEVESVENLQLPGSTIPTNNTPFLPPPHIIHEEQQQHQQQKPQSQPPIKPPPRRRNTKRKQRTAEEEAEKRRIFLERNRMAAQKCRSRKKRQTCTLEDDLALQEEINARLKLEVADLTAELEKLKEVYLQCEQECRNAKIQQGVMTNTTTTDATMSGVQMEEVESEGKKEEEAMEEERIVEAMDVS